MATSSHDPSPRRRRDRAPGAALALALSLGLLAGCAANQSGNLSGSAVGGSSGLSGHVWQDGNGNGTPDGSEPASAGMTLTLWSDGDHDGACGSAADPQVGTTQTAADGSYRFPDLPPGDVCVQMPRSVVPNGWPGGMSDPQTISGTGVMLNIPLP